MSEPHYQDDSVTLYHGDCLDVLRALPDASVDSVVTDPPYDLTNRTPDVLGCTDCGRTLGGRDGTPDACPRCGGELTRQRSAQGKGFMGKAWDGTGIAFRPDVWRECLRVLKPGGHMLAFGGTRTWHRLACAVEDAGFEVRDSIAWLYGSGFPKSLDVSKAIDKRRDWKSLPLLQAKVREARKTLGISQSEAARRVGLIGPDESLGGGGFMWFETGMRVPTREQYPHLKSALNLDDECDRAFEEAEREVTGTHVEWENRTNYALTSRDGLRRDIPATPDAERWQGWGTALKPAFEPVVVARKPLTGTVAKNVLQHGTGALNIDGCRTETSDDLNGGAYSETGGRAVSASLNPSGMNAAGATAHGTYQQPAGRWPANVLLDDTQAAALDEQSGESASPSKPVRQGGVVGYDPGENAGTAPRDGFGVGYGDSGGASRFFPTFRYEAKAPTSERPRVNGTAHPTVKPLTLMSWLVRLVTPSGGTVLEPFAGSGTTVEACIVEGFHCIAIEREAEYLPLIMQRVNRRRDPVAYIEAAGDDLGLFGIGELA